MVRIISYDQYDSARDELSKIATTLSLFLSLPVTARSLHAFVEIAASGFPPIVTENFQVDGDVRDGQHILSVHVLPAD